MKNEKTIPSEDVFIWVRVPVGTSQKKIKKLGPVGSVCHGGDTCICAPVFSEKAGIVLQGPNEVTFEELMKKAGFVPQSRCYGGDTCIA
jgi:hypothetical protein